ncbi:hypothetical protein [Paenibacillus sp.]|uniref:hypothetical protein n=1 Tax=Paenibacillus sp. TaxID=58172 RepID=UPI002D3D9D63|nr:hypothetical protein [Paenibacillus sp.]HZG84796.1 hypothetical protein [Paenibacillus sp.]
MVTFRQRMRRFLGRRVFISTTALAVEEAGSAEFDGVLRLVGKDVLVIISEQRPIAIRISEIISVRPLNGRATLKRKLT